MKRTIDPWRNIDRRELLRRTALLLPALHGGFLVGPAKARELYYLSDRIDAAEALRLGLVNRVVPDDTLEAQTLELAGRIAHGPTIAYQYMKENLNRAVGGNPFECMDLEATHHVHTSLTEDHRNAVRAFVEKRKPEFKGR